MKLNKPHLRHLFVHEVDVPSIPDTDEAYSLECGITLKPTSALQTWLDENRITSFELGFDCKTSEPIIEFTHRGDYEKFAASFPAPVTENQPA